MEALYTATAFISLKASTIIAAAIMAGLGFMLDSRKHSFLTAALAITAGTAMAVILTDPLSDYLHLGPSWNNAIAGVLGISGRNLIMLVNRFSADPRELMKLWRNKGPEE